MSEAPVLGGPVSPGRVDPEPLWRLILIPSAITLAVTVLRVFGELQGWPSPLFGRAAGGGAALVGITWLVPVFGAWFALKLARGASGVQPTRVLGVGAVAVVVVFAMNLFVALIKKEQSGLGIMGVFAVSSVFGAMVAVYAWPALGRTLLAYGLAARIPVVLVTLAAIRGDWRTHYDTVPPIFPSLAPLARWFWIGIVPQMTIWMAFTVIVGTVAGGLALLVEERRATGRRAPRTVRPVGAVARSASPIGGTASPLVQPAPRVRPAASPAPTVRPASPAPTVRPASPARPASPSPTSVRPTPTAPPTEPPSIVQPAPPRGPRRT